MRGGYWHPHKGERCPDGFGYSWFAERYRAYAGRLDVVLRQEHRAGEKLFIDFPGDTIPIVYPPSIPSLAGPPQRKAVSLPRFGETARQPQG